MKKSGKTIWTWSVILFVVGFVFWLALGFLFLRRGPGPSDYARDRQRACYHNLQQIGWALCNYCKSHRHLPPSVPRDERSGTPRSWRVDLLPFLEEKCLYEVYHCDKAWDSKENSFVASAHIADYFCPADFAPSNATSYLMLQRTQESSVADDSKTDPDKVIIVEVCDSGVRWAEPRDIRLDEFISQINNPARKNTHSGHPGGFHVLRCDESGATIEFLKDNLSPEELRRLFKEK